MPVWLQQGYPRIFKFPDTHNIPQLHFQSWWILSIGPSIMVGACWGSRSRSAGNSDTRSVSTTKARFAIPSQIRRILGDFRLGAAHLSGKKGQNAGSYGSYGCYPKDSFLRINTHLSWCPKMKSSSTKPWFLRYLKGVFNLVGKGLTAVSGTIVWQRLAAKHNPLIRHSGGHVPVVRLYTSFLNTSLYSKFTWARDAVESSKSGVLVTFTFFGEIIWNMLFFLLHLCLSNKLTQICSNSLKRIDPRPFVVAAILSFFWCFVSTTLVDRHPAWKVQSPFWLDLRFCGEKTGFCWFKGLIMLIIMMMI